MVQQQQFSCSVDPGFEFDRSGRLEQHVGGLFKDTCFPVIEHSMPWIPWFLSNCHCGAQGACNDHRPETTPQGPWNRHVYSGSGHSTGIVRRRGVGRGLLTGYTSPFPESVYRDVPPPRKHPGMNDWQRAEQHADRALEFFDRGRLAEAEHELRQALSIHPDNADWHFNLGLTLEASGREGEALERFEQAAKLAPDQMHPMLAAGSMNLRLEQWEKARSWFEEARRHDAESEDAYAGLIEAWNGLGNHEEAEATFYMAEWSLEEPSALCHAAMAHGLIAQSDWTRAESCLRTAMGIDPDLPELRARLALVLVRTDRGEQAMSMLNRVLQDNADDLEALFASATLLDELARWPEAIERLERLLRLDPLHLDAHELLASIALRTRHFDRAIFEYQLVLRLYPAHGPSMLGLAEALLSIGRIEDASLLLDHVYKRRETTCRRSRLDASPLDRLASLLLAVGRDEEAMTTARESIERSGQSNDRLRNLALAAFRSGHSEIGWKASRRVLRLEPGCIRSIHNLALSSLESGRYRLAAGWISRGLACHPGDEDLRRLRVRLWTRICLRKILPGSRCADREPGEA